MSQLSVLIFDDNYLTTSGLLNIVGKKPELMLVGQTNALSQMTQIPNYKNIGMVIVHIHANDFSCLPHFESLIEIHPTKVIVIVPNDATLLINALWKLGMTCIITSDCTEKEMDTAIDHSCKGQRYYCNTVLEIITQSVQKTNKNDLSARETEVLKLIASGQSTLHIADSLHVSIHTINSHRKNIMKKLELISPVQLIVYAVKNNLLHM